MPAVMEDTDLAWVTFKAPLQCRFAENTSDRCPEEAEWEIPNASTETDCHRCHGLVYCKEHTTFIWDSWLEESVGANVFCVYCGGEVVLTEPRPLP